MKKYKKLIVALLVSIMGLNLTACASKPDTFTYELTAKNWNTEGITVKYPLFVNTNNQDKADILNDLIMGDIGAVIEDITTNAPDTKGLTIDGIYDYSEVKNALLSISYQGTSLSDLFTIDDNFAEIFKMGIYVASSEGLDLEGSGLNIGDTISEQYTNEQLIALFSDLKANYFLQEGSLILSVEVPHAIGDYLEMAIRYEGLEGNIKKEHPYWSNYLFLAEAKTKHAYISEAIAKDSVSTQAKVVTYYEYTSHDGGTQPIQMYTMAI